MEKFSGARGFLKPGRGAVNPEAAKAEPQEQQFKLRLSSAWSLGLGNGVEEVRDSDARLLADFQSQSATHAAYHTSRWRCRGLKIRCQTTLLYHPSPVLQSGSSGFAVPELGVRVDICFFAGCCEMNSHRSARLSLQVT